MNSTQATKAFHQIIDDIMLDLSNKAGETMSARAKESLQRNIVIAKNRFCVDWPSNQTPTLDAIAEKHLMTRERIRQIIAKVCDSITKNKTDTSALAQFIHAGHHTPLQGSTLYGLSIAAKELCHIHVESSEKKRPDAIRNARIEAVAMSVSNKLTQRNGAVNIYLAHSMACDQIDGITQKEFRSVLTGLPNFEWLDEDLGWYSIKEGDDETRNRLKNLINKVLACASQWVSVDEIYAQLGRQRRKDNASEDETPFISVPASVIKALMLRSKTYKHVGFDRFEINKDAIENSDPAATFLSNTEIEIYNAMKSLGAIATRNEIRKIVVDENGVNINSFTMTWETSPIIWPLEHSIHKIAGWKLNAKALKRAQDIELKK